MAIIHYDVTFEREAPSLEQVKRKIEQRIGLEVHLWKDSLERDCAHDWPHIGRVRESGSLECDEADESDLELTIGSQGVRVSCVAPGVNPYFRDATIQALVDLGGGWKARLSPHVGKRWAELTPAERNGR